MTDPNHLNIVLGTLVGAITVSGAIGALNAWRGRSVGERALARFADRAALPVPAASAAALEAYMRHRKLVDYLALSAAGAVGGLLLLTPLGLTTFSPLGILIPAMYVTMLVVSCWSTLHERLFAPAQGSIRIARSRGTTVGDYLAGLPRALTWILLGLALTCGVGVAWSLAAGSVARIDLAAVALMVTAVALATCVVLPRLEAAIVRRPQPAGSELELAWEDARRIAALNGCRQGAAALCIAAALIAGVAVFSGPDGDPGWTASVFVILVLPLTYLYPTQGAAVPRRLHPDGIHVTARSIA